MTINSIALLGLPNSGKSTLFNLLTGSRQRTANFPGITVEKRSGIHERNGEKLSIIDLPGLYTLDALSLDEKVTRDFVFEKNDNQCDLFVLVLDATNLKKNLYMALQMKELGQKFVVALNMMDVANKRGLKLDKEKLELFLDSKVALISAAKNEGIEDLLAIIQERIREPKKELNYQHTYQTDIKSPVYIKDKLSSIDKILKDIIIQNIRVDSLTNRIDNVVLHPFFGVLILGIVLVFTFQLLFVWADPFVAMIESLFEWMGSMAITFLPEGLVRDLLVNGILAGVGGIVVFVPHIFFLFILIGILDDFGYLGRAAFLLDFIMRKAGLSGTAVVPLLSSHACAIPGIMGARIIQNPRERMIVMMIAPLMSCSARLPVYTLLIAAIIPSSHYFWGLSYSGLTLFALYSFGIITSFLIALIFNKSSIRKSPSYLLMELPSYRRPKFLNILKNAYKKSSLFVKKAGTIILILSMVIWALVTFPGAPKDADQSAINYSYAAKIGKTFEPLFKPLGYDWRIVTALIPSFAAREVLVSSLSTVMANDELSEDEDAAFTSLTGIMSSQFSIATLISLMVWFVFSPQCISTFAVLRKETNSFLMPAIYGFYSLALAYFFAFLAFRITTMLS